MLPNEVGEGGGGFGNERGLFPHALPDRENQAFVKQEALFLIVIMNEGQLTTVHDVFWVHLMPCALNSSTLEDPVNSGIVMQIHPIIQCDHIIISNL